MRLFWQLHSQSIWSSRNNPSFQRSLSSLFVTPACLYNTITQSRAGDWFPTWWMICEKGICGTSNSTDNFGRYIRSEIVSSGWQVRWIMEVANFMMRLFWYLHGQRMQFSRNGPSFQRVSSLFVNLVFLYTIPSWNAELEILAWWVICERMWLCYGHFQFHKEHWFISLLNKYSYSSESFLQPPNYHKKIN